MTLVEVECWVISSYFSIAAAVAAIALALFISTQSNHDDHDDDEAGARLVN